MLLNLLQLLRIKQWAKNTFVLAPLIFSGKFLVLYSIGDSLLAMWLFCLASSAAYIVNDIFDIEHDKMHATKSLKRPLASGKLKITHALGLLIFIYLLLASAFLLQFKVMLVISAYLVLNLFYTYTLKEQPVIDIFCIAIGFVLRVYAGAMALNVAVSSWMFVTTLSLALYLAAMKRRQELLVSNSQSRKVLKVYTVDLVSRYAEIAATGTLLFYSLYVMTVHDDLVITIPLVLYGLFRFWFIAECFQSQESPTDSLLSDWQLLMTVFIWVGLCVWSIWPA